MTTLQINFKTTSGEPLSLQWLLHNRPYVNDWVDGLKKFLSTSNIDSEKYFHDSQICFCSSEKEFKDLWQDVKNLTIKHTPYWETPRSPKKNFLERVLKFTIEKISTSSSIISQNHLEELKDLSKKIPSLLFWIGSEDYRKAGAKVWGMISTTPQWGSSIVLRDSDKEFITTDLSFGNLYGKNIFRDLSWMDIGLMDGDDDNPSQDLKDFISKALIEKRVDGPIAIGPGFEIPFCPDITGSDLIVMDILSKGNNLKELKNLGYEAEDIVDNLGKYELGRILTSLTNETYNLFKEISSIESIDFLDDTE